MQNLGSTPQSAAGVIIGIFISALLLIPLIPFIVCQDVAARLVKGRREQ